MTIPTSRRGSDAGFSLVELLVVIVIIGILAAIAIPLYLDQQSKSRDAAAQSDAMNLGLFIRTAWDESSGGTVTVSFDGTSYVVAGEPVFAASPGVQFVGYTATAIDDWCVALRHPAGDKAANPGVRFDSDRGYVEQATC